MGNEATGKLPAHIKSTSDGLLNFDRFVGFLAAVEGIEEGQNTDIILFRLQNIPGKQSGASEGCRLC